MPSAICSTAVAIAFTILAAASTAAAAAPLRLAQARPAAPAASEACSLLTKEDAAAALGGPVTGPRSSAVRSAMGPGTTASSCEYAGSGLRKVNLSLWRASADTAAQFRQMYQTVCAKKKKDGLAGLGDMACWYNDQHEELQVLKGSAFFAVELRGSGNPTEAITGVAKKVADRLR